MRSYRNQLFVIVACLSIATTAAAQDTSRTRILLDAAGKTISAPTSWDDGSPVEVRFQPYPAEACRLRLTYRWHDDVKEPAPVSGDVTALVPIGCEGQALSSQPSDPHFVVPRMSPDRRMLTYSLWRIIGPDTTLQSVTAPALELELQRLGQNPDLSALPALYAAIAKTTASERGIIATRTEQIAVAERTLAGLDADAKLFSSASTVEAATRLTAIATEIRTARAGLESLQDAQKLSRQRVQDLEAIRQRVQSYEGAIQGRHHDCSRVSLIKVGGVLPSARSKSVYYDFTRTPAPPGFSLVLIATYPLVTQDDRLFAIVANRRLADHPYPFVLSATRQVTPPPSLASVRPTIQAIQNAPFSVAATSASTCPAQPSVEIGSVETAFRDSVLPFQDRFTGNDVLTVSISSYLDHLTGDKTTTTVEGSKPPVVTKQTVVEGKVVKLLDDVKYPQVRALYRFNIATGVAVTNLREESFVRVKIAANDPDTGTLNEARYRLDTQDGPRRVMPLFLFSTYLKRVDIQEPVWKPWWKLARPGWRSFPAPALGFALTSPADNVYLGFTSEVFENIHVFGGWHNGKIAERVIPTLDDQGQELSIPNNDRDDADPKTRSVRRWDWSYGVTFNINIITTFFK